MGILKETYPSGKVRPKTPKPGDKRSVPRDSSWNPQPMSTPPPDRILSLLGPPLEEKVLVHDREFRLLKPCDSDRLFNDADVRSAHADDEYMPYWADLWPAARMLAKVLLREPLTAGAAALEIGCGLGLPGVVALSRGLRVTFSDYDPCALYYAAANARLNGFHDFQTLELDWCHPPAGLQVSILLASDLIYELRNIEPLIAFIRHVLSPGGTCYLTDQDRLPSHALRQHLEDAGLPFSTEIVRAGEPGGRRLRGTLYRITRQVSA
jgi:predicted nicotinamide N-methyase